MQIKDGADSEIKIEFEKKANPLCNHWNLGVLSRKETSNPNQPVYQ